MSRKLDADSSWLRTVQRVMSEGEDASPRGKLTREVLGCQSVIDMSQPVVTNVGRNTPGYFAFMLAEAVWILSGDNRVSSIQPYSKMIKRFSDDGRHFGGAYGPKIVDQLSYVTEALCKDPSSRQAYINIWRERPGDTKDVPCTLGAQFLIRDDRLHCFDTMRSSDIWLGWPFDVFNFSMLAHYIILLIRERGGPALKPGKLWFTAGSQHAYATDWDKIEALDETLDPGVKPLDPLMFDSPDDFLLHLRVVRDLTHAGAWTAPIYQDYLAEIPKLASAPRG